MNLLRALLSCALLIGTGTVLADEPRCADVDAPPAQVCVATPHGLAYAHTRAEAESAARALDDAARKFAIHFGHPPTGALMLSTSFRTAREFAASDRLAYGQIWLPVQAHLAMTERAMRQAGLDRKQIRQATARMAEQHENSLRHEVGHALYAALFWPQAAQDPTRRYGSPAPDWLDESAAILMEGPET